MGLKLRKEKTGIMYDPNVFLQSKSKYIHCHDVDLKSVCVVFASCLVLQASVMHRKQRLLPNWKTDHFLVNYLQQVGSFEK